MWLFCAQFLVCFSFMAAFKIPFIESKSLTKEYFDGIPSFRWCDVVDKDEIGKGSFVKGSKVTMVPTWKREASKFYCVKKECILRRHPYFWKGMIKIGSDVQQMLKDGHRKLLKEVLHLSL